MATRELVEDGEMSRLGTEDRRDLVLGQPLQVELARRVGAERELVQQPVGGALGVTHVDDRTLGGGAEQDERGEQRAHIYYVSWAWRVRHPRRSVGGPASQA